MSKNSCLTKLEKDTFVIIRKSNLILCEGNECAAALINYYAFRYDSKLTELDEKVANNKNYKISEKDYLIQASNQYLMNGLLNQFSRNQVIQANSFLMSLGFIKIITNVPNPSGGKPINHILFNADLINKRLKQDVEQRLEQDVATSQLGRSQRLKQDVATSQLGRNKDKEKDNLKDKEKSEEFLQNSPTPTPPQILKKELPTKLKPILFKHDELYENLINFFEAYPEKWESMIFEKRIKTEQIDEDKRAAILKDFALYRFSKDKYDGSPSLESNIARFETWLGWKAERLRTDTYFEENTIQGNRQSDKAKPLKFELYTEGYLQNILAPQDKNLVEQLKQFNPSGLERYFNMWKERKYTDDNIEGQFPGYAKKRIKEALLSESTQIK